MTDFNASLHAEAAVLGGLMMDPGAWSRVVGTISASDFALEAHRCIFRHLADLAARGEPLDPLTVGEALERAEELDAVGGLAAVGQLVADTPSAANIAAYAGIVRERAQERAARDHLLDLAERVGAQPLDTLLGDAFANLANLAANRRSATRPPPADALVVTEQEMAAARLTPRCIVRDHTFADVAQIAGPGGTGKSTLLVYESVCIALGLPLWGLDVEAPGWTLYVTKEDKREQLVARLRETVAALDLSPEDRARAIAGVRFWDLTGEQVRLIAASDGNVVLTSLADDLVTAYAGNPPAVVIFDPLVSFGAAENLVNDNEQGLILAARRIVKGLDCCVRLVHHTGKVNARDGALDQYAGRGGSALPDGSRMTTILQPWKPEDRNPPPPGLVPDAKSSVLLMARAKLSYSPPNLPVLWIKRTGYRFEHHIHLPQSKDQARAARAEQIGRFLGTELRAGRYHTRATLEPLAGDLGMSRSELRAALALLMAEGRLHESELPPHLKRGSRQTYLAANLAAPSDDTPDGPTESAPTSPPSTTSPPYRDGTGGEVAPTDSTPVPSTSPITAREVAARWRDSDDEVIRAHLAAIGETDPDLIREATTDPNRRAYWLAEAHGARP